LKRSDWLALLKADGKVSYKLSLLQAVSSKIFQKLEKTSRPVSAVGAVAGRGVGFL
jgi:hypothetical protein